MTVVADLDAVTSADASTVAWLMHADAVVRLAGGRFVTVLGNGRAGDVLRLTGVGRRLDVVGSLHHADRRGRRPGLEHQDVVGALGPLLAALVGRLPISGSASRKACSDSQRESPIRRLLCLSR